MPRLAKIPESIQKRTGHSSGLHSPHCIDSPKRGQIGKLTLDTRTARQNATKTASASRQDAKTEFQNMRKQDRSLEKGLPCTPESVLAAPRKLMKPSGIQACMHRQTGLNHRHVLSLIGICDGCNFRVLGNIEKGL